MRAPLIRTTLLVAMVFLGAGVAVLAATPDMPAPKSQVIERSAVESSSDDPFAMLRTIV